MTGSDDEFTDDDIECRIERIRGLADGTVVPPHRPRSADVKYFEKRLSERIHEQYADVDPSEWLDVFDGGPFDDTISGMAQSWGEVIVLIATLERSHLDDDYTPDQIYPVVHLPTPVERHAMRNGEMEGDPDTPVRRERTRAGIVARLEKIANLDLGDDPEMWRRWFTAFDEDPLFPPVR